MDRNLPMDDKTLIVGSDGELGSFLLKKLSGEFRNLYGTSRRKYVTAKNKIYLDLEDIQAFNFNANFNSVIYCAGISGEKFHQENPEKARQINQHKTIDFIGQLLIRKIYVIYISTNLVFDGLKSFYEYNDKKNPITLYGKIKSEVEDFFLNSNYFATLRITKFISENSPIIVKWHDEFSKNMRVTAYSNRLISPIYPEDLSEAILLLLKTKKNGIFQLGGKNELSYLDLAKEYFKEDKEIYEAILETVDPTVDQTQLIHNSLTTYLPR